MMVLAAVHKMEVPVAGRAAHEMNSGNIHRNHGAVILLLMGYLSSLVQHTHCGPCCAHFEAEMDTSMGFAGAVYSFQHGIASRAWLDCLYQVPTLNWRH